MGPFPLASRAGGGEGDGMFGRLLILFIAIPILELALFLKLGRLIGVVPTLAIILVTAVLGASLARRQGLQVVGRLQAEMAAGRLPHAEIVDGLLILMAGALLITPGFLTDGLGFLLLAPPFRAKLRPWLARALVGKFVVSGAGGASTPGPTEISPRKSGVIEVEAEVVDEKRER